MVGLGVMGRNLLLNMAEHGYSVAGYDTDLEKVQALNTEGHGRDVQGVKSIEELVKLKRSPTHHPTGPRRWTRSSGNFDNISSRVT